MSEARKIGLDRRNNCDLCSRAGTRLVGGDIGLRLVHFGRRAADVALSGRGTIGHLPHQAAGATGAQSDRQATDGAAAGCLIPGFVVYLAFITGTKSCSPATAAISGSTSSVVTRNATLPDTR